MVKDSNLRSRKTTGLQPAPIGRSGNHPQRKTYGWSWRWDLNPQPAAYKAAALPIELRQQTPLLFDRPRISVQLHVSPTPFSESRVG